MERLTDRYLGYIGIKGCTSCYKDVERKSTPFSNAIVRLARYEDTNMTPEEITDLKETLDMYGGTYGITTALEELKRLRGDAENNPLTIEEILQMDGQPVFYRFPHIHGDKPITGWGIVYIRDGAKYPKDILIVDGSLILSCWDYNNDTSFKVYRNRVDETS